MIAVTIYLFRGAYTIDAVDVVIAAIAKALRMQVNIVQNVNGKVAVIFHVPHISGSSRGKATLLNMHKPSHKNIDDHYNAIVKMLEDIIQQYENEAWGLIK